MKDIAPQITRKRLIFEGIYETNFKFSAETIKSFLIELSEVLKMTVVHGPLVNNWSQRYNPKKYAGFEAWVMWAESGAQLYVWEKTAKLITVDIFTCKSFDEEKAIDFIKNWFKCKELEYMIIP